MVTGVRTVTPGTTKGFRIAFIAACCLAFAPQIALSQETYPRVWLNPGFFSFHFDRDKNLREDNWGLGADVEFSEDHSVIAGTYVNSDRARSRYIGYQWRPLHWRLDAAEVHVGAILAAIDGYPRMRDGDWFLAALPVLTVERGRLGANFTIVPTIEDRLNGALVLQLRLRIW